ncbi:MAG: amino-acid N-acetyltransferase [Rectinemataceae bacterium]|jgi:amino-acid N-acetyltransferase
MSDDFTSRRDETDLIREVFVYAHRFMGSVFVFRIGARLMDNPSFTGLVSDLALLHENGIKIILVPSGGARIDELLAIYGIATERAEGLRISTPEAMPLIQMAAFDTATRLMNQLARNKVEAVVGNWVRARSYGVRNGIDFQATGMVDKVNVELIARSLDDDFVPILPCIGWSAIGEPYNISSVELATELAIGLRARKLFFLTEGELFASTTLKLPSEGVASRDGVVSRMTVPAAERTLADNPDALGRTEREMLAHSVTACRSGVERVHFLDGGLEGAVLKEVFSTLGSGTMVHADPFENIRPMNEEDIPDVLRIMEPHVQQGNLVRRTEGELQRDRADYAVFEADGTIRGCGALHRSGPDRAEIAALAVDVSFMHLGIGQRMVSYLIEEARRAGLAGVFVLTTRTSDWFLRLGFSHATVDELPEERRLTYDTDRKSRIYSLSLARREG